MNGGALLGPNAFPVAQMLAVQVHEFGHYQNLAHTVVNGQIVAGPDSRGPSPLDTFPPVSFVNRIETMYPFLFINGGQATPHADDVAMFSTLYPEPEFAASTGTITGIVVAPNNTSPVTGVNVIAPTWPILMTTRCLPISSHFTEDFTSGSPFVGVYTLRGLTPGASYAIYVDQIVIGGFSTPPRDPLPGVEESQRISGVQRRGHRSTGRVHTGRGRRRRHGSRYRHHLQSAATWPDSGWRRDVVRVLPDVHLRLLRATLRVGVWSTRMGT